MPNAPSFLFVTCQLGAEGAVKAELAQRWPAFRFAYSRPGFLTFKLPEADLPAADFDLASVFARAYGFSLGPCAGTTDEQRAAELLQAAAAQQATHLHLWQRDRAVPGDYGFEPGPSPRAEEAARLVSLWQQSTESEGRTLRINERARAGERVLDCILVEDDQWWLGHHQATGIATRCVGGVPAIRKPEEMISRAYLKMAEALVWSKLPIERGDQCVEIGSSPGGSCQCLLDRGMEVIGIDPAVMDERILEHPRFRHLRARASDLKRREFRRTRWLMADSNVAPTHTLDSVEAIVTHSSVNVRGMLLTLKLLEWDLASQVDEYLGRIRSWGYHYARARQLGHNRQEICVVALRRKAMLRLDANKKHRRRKDS